ncbi:MAG: hypothetical protein ACI814_004095 [Mariniblastus sp.]|jgi:hypothetical protein
MMPAQDPFVSDKMFDELYQPVTIDAVREAIDVDVQYPVNSLSVDRNVTRTEGLTLAKQRPEPTPDRLVILCPY